LDLAAMSGLRTHVDGRASWRTVPAVVPMDDRTSGSSPCTGAARGGGLRRQLARSVIALVDPADSLQRRDIKTMPIRLCVVRDGRLQWLHRGSRPADRKDLDARVHVVLHTR
jgi:hypothetical protein